MVGLVFVAHSHELAQALLGLVRQVTAQETPIAIAAGVGSNRREFGTDAADILEAIQAVYSPDGVLVLMDIGSAVLSAETALDLLPEGQRQKILLCSAPLVEGAIAAAVQAGLGSDLETVNTEALKALDAKIEHLNPNPSNAPPQPEVALASSDANNFRSVTLVLQNLHGLHARPAARFVQTASHFNAEIRVSNLSLNKGPISAKSINRLATLGAVSGHQIKIEARGLETTQALESLSQLVKNNFYEKEENQGGVEKAAPKSSKNVSKAKNLIQGVPISEGIALGPLYRYHPPPPPIPTDTPNDAQAEWNRLQAALTKTRQAIQRRQARLRDRLEENQTAIFDAHLLILQDPDLLESVRKRIFQNGSNAAVAWSESIKEVAASYGALEDSYQQARHADVLEIGNQALQALSRQNTGEIAQLPNPSVLYAQEITPGEVAQLDAQLVLGVVTARGGPTSHSAILARSLGVPAISGIDLESLNIQPDALVGLDGSQGVLWINPTQDDQRQLTARRQVWLTNRQRLLSTSHEPARSRDGRLYEVAANVGNLIDAQAAALNGADGIGVLRTEFLFLRRSSPPSEEEQLQTYIAIGDKLGNLPIVVRTLDVGGDKPLPYIHLPAEMNPFLGIRALRYSLQNPELLLTQLRAILRAGVQRNLAVMFPMVAILEEILQAKDWLAQAHRALKKEKIAHRWPIKTGIMVEIPSAALLSPSLAAHVDFFSIGTNDLTQYTLAAERGNPLLSRYSDALHPAVLRLVKQVAEAAHHFNKWVGVCGEIASDRLAIPILFGLGVDELSVNPADIPRVKSTIRELDLTAIRKLADQSTQLDTAQATRELVKNYYKNSKLNTSFQQEAQSC